MNEEEKKEYFEHIKAQKSDELTPFEMISNKISHLVMFSKIINNHPEELQPKYYNIIKKRNIKPSEPLMQYILLEIRNFYHTAYGRFKDEIEYPEYVMEELKDFRDSTVAHMSKDATRKDIVEEYERFNKIGFKKVYSDWLNFRNLIFNKLKK